MHWRAKSRAKFQGRSVEAVIADVERARKALRAAPEIVLSPGITARDLRGQKIPELPEAAAREGLCFIADVPPGRDGRVKIVCQSGSQEQIRAFMEHWGPAHGLQDIYGDPARGFAGGYVVSDKRGREAKEEELRAEDYPTFEAAILGAQSKLDASHVLRGGDGVSVYSSTSKGYVRHDLFKRGDMWHWERKGPMLPELPADAKMIHEVIDSEWEPGMAPRMAAEAPMATEAADKIRPSGEVGEVPWIKVETAPCPADEMRSIPWRKIERDPKKYRKMLQASRAMGKLTTPEAVYRALEPALSKEDQEVFLVVAIDARGYCRGVVEVHRGERSSVPISVPDVIRNAVALGGSMFVVVHNHPSGDANPSEADRDVTSAIEKAAKASEMLMADHVIIGIDQFYSFAGGGLTKTRSS